MEPTFMEIFYWAILPALAQAVAVFLGVFLSLLLASKRLLSQVRKEFAIGHRNASEIVRERYARGEISRREYEQLREDLGPERTFTETESGYQRTQ